MLYFTLFLSNYFPQFKLLIYPVHAPTIEVNFNGEFRVQCQISAPFQVKSTRVAIVIGWSFFLQFSATIGKKWQLIMYWATLVFAHTHRMTTRANKAKLRHEEN